MRIRINNTAFLCVGVAVIREGGGLNVNLLAKFLEPLDVISGLVKAAGRKLCMLYQPSYTVLYCKGYWFHPFS